MHLEATLLLLQQAFEWGQHWFSTNTHYHKFAIQCSTIFQNHFGNL